MKTILPAEQQHYSQLVDVWEASVRATHDFLTEEDINFFRPLILQQYLSSVSAYYIAGDDSQILGFIGVADGNIEMLFIHPDSRGKGIGKRLLKYAIEELGAKRVDVNEQNQQGVDFYLYMGFKVAGRSETDGTGKPFPLLHLVYN